MYIVCFIKISCRSAGSSVTQAGHTAWQAFTVCIRFVVYNYSLLFSPLEIPRQECKVIAVSKKP